MKESKFKDAQFLTAKEKELIYKDFVRFIEKGFQLEHFTNRLYEHLHLHCGFIAHYDKGGFYDYYFEEPGNTISFINKFDKDIRYFNSYILNCDNSDIITAFCDFIDNVKSDVYKKCSNLERDKDIETAKSLLKKHSIKFSIEDAIK